MTYFDIGNDNSIITGGGFFCGACLVSKPAGEQSDDPRYCHSCFKFLIDEVELLNKKDKIPAWVPSVNATEINPGGVIPLKSIPPVSYTHLTLPTTPYV